MEQSHSLSYRIKNVLRIAWTLPFVLASVTGVALALSDRQEWTMAVLIPLDVLFLAMFVNLSNDYFDHRSGADKVRFTILDKAFQEVVEDKGNTTIYWQGNSFDRGLISDRGGKVLLAVLAAIAVVLAIPIVLFGGWMVLVLGAVAFFLAFFYTAPPLNLGARGLGELDVLASFTMISFFSYFVIVQSFSGEALLIGLIIGLGAMIMRIVDEMSGLEAHLASGEKDLVVRYGIDGATNIVAGILVVLYLVDALLLLFSLTYVLLFLTMPFAARIVRQLRNAADELRVMRPVLDALKLALLDAVLIVISLSMQTVLTSV